MCFGIPGVSRSEAAVRLQARLLREMQHFGSHSLLLYTNPQQLRRPKVHSMRNVIQDLLGVAAWLSVPVLAAAYWTPGKNMVRTSLGGDIEHFAAYPVVTLVFVLAYPLWSPYRIGAALALYAGFLELGQLFVPGRHAQLDNFASSCFGIALVIGLTLWWRRTLSPRVPGST